MSLRSHRQPPGVLNAEGHSLESALRDAECYFRQVRSLLHSRAPVVGDLNGAIKYKSLSCQLFEPTNHISTQVEADHPPLGVYQGLFVAQRLSCLEHAEGDGRVR
jgi:hypothetical protein